MNTAHEKKMVVLTSDSPWLEMVQAGSDPTILSSTTHFKINGQPHRLVAVKAELDRSKDPFEPAAEDFWCQVGETQEANRALDLLDTLDDSSSDDPFVMTEIDNTGYVVYAVPVREPLERSTGGEVEAESDSSSTR